MTTGFMRFNIGLFRPSRTGVALVLAAFTLSACAGQLPFLNGNFSPFGERACNPRKSPCPEVLTPDEDTMRPRARPGSAVNTGGTSLFLGARPEDIDTTTAAELAEATSTPTGGQGRRIGKTIVSLGDVTSPGFWVETPLVKEEVQGRVVWADNGNSVLVTLRPRDGAASAGSQISLAAMRALGIPLTALPELLVFRQ